MRCVDGRELAVLAVPVPDRAGVPYEATLRLLLDGAPWGEVGQRCLGLLAGVRERVGPGAGELFDLRSRDPDDVPSGGELRARVDVDRTWTGAGWTERPRVVLQAWGDDGCGVGAVLSLEELCRLLDDLLGTCGGG